MALDLWLSNTCLSGPHTWSLFPEPDMFSLRAAYLCFSNQLSFFRRILPAWVELSFSIWHINPLSEAKLDPQGDLGRGCTSNHDFSTILLPWMSLRRCKWFGTRAQECDWAPEGPECSSPPSSYRGLMAVRFNTLRLWEHSEHKGLM